jgi:hypothetical protein
MHRASVFSVATIACTEFRFTNTDGLRVACAPWDSGGPVSASITAGTAAPRALHGRFRGGALDVLARLASSASAGKNILNGPFEPARTPFDWLSRDSAVVYAFISGPLCFAQLQPAAQSSFFAASNRLSDPVSLSKIRNDLPIYLFSGSEDPVGQQLEVVQVLIERLSQAASITSLLHWIFAVLERRKGYLLREPNRGTVPALNASHSNPTQVTEHGPVRRSR